MRLLPKTLTFSRRQVLKQFLLEEKRQLEAHLKALEGCKLAEDLYSQMRPVVMDENESSPRETIESLSSGGQVCMEGLFFAC